tara:strand:+ start:142 stop:267 length:126 start_codon:yes stop_codon:yes gene_type:complete
LPDPLVSGTGNLGFAAVWTISLKIGLDIVSILVFHPSKLTL